MRISPAGLLVVLALAVPVVVQLRTVLAFVGIHITALQTVVIGVLVLAAIVVWAVFPESRTEAEDDNSNRSNGD